MKKGIFRYPGPILLAVLLAFLASACGAAPNRPKLSEPLIGDTCKDKKWVENTPPNDARFFYFSAKGDKAASEKEARDSARRGATAEFVNYTGMEVSVVRKFLQTVRDSGDGSTTSVASGSEESVMQAMAKASRVRVKAWCSEKYERRRGGEVEGYSYIAGALIIVPIQEVRRVIAFKKTLETEGMLRYLGQASHFYDTALKAEGEGKLRQALTGLGQARATLDSAMAEKERVNVPLPLDALTEAEIRIAEQRIKAALGSGVMKGLAGQVREKYEAGLRLAGEGLLVTALASFHEAAGLLREAERARGDTRLPAGTPSAAMIASAETRFISRLVLRGEPAAPQTIEPGERPRPLGVRATFSEGGRTVPVGDLPVSFSTSGNVLHGGKTDSAGRAAMPPIGPLREGRYRYVARADLKGVEGRISPAALRALAAVRADFEITARFGTPEERAAALVAQLGEGVRGGSTTVVVGNFTHADDGTAGVFSKRFQAILEAALGDNPRFILKKRKPLTRGFVNTKGDSKAAQAVAAEASTVLDGTYFRDGEQVVVKGDLTYRDNQEVRSDTVKIHRKKIPAGWTLVPANNTQVKNNARVLGGANAAGGGDFRLEFWLDKGDGAIYEAGDLVTAYVRSAVDCYLRLIYLDAGGNKIIVFPNRFQPDNFIKANRIYEIPPSGNPNFRFRVQPPFGAENFVAFASSKPFPPASGQKIASTGVVILNESLGVIARKSRGIGVQGASAQRAEKRVTMTTIPK